MEGIVDKIRDVERDEILRREIASAGLKAILAWYPEDIVMMGGTWPCNGITLCLYPVDGQPIFYAGAGEPEDVLPAGFAHRRFTPQQGGWGELRNQLAADLVLLGVRGGELGITEDVGQHALPSFSGETPSLSQAGAAIILEGMSARDATPLFDRLSQKKTRLEIEAIRRTNAVARAGLEAFHASLKPGRSEVQISAAAESAIQERSGTGGCTRARGWAHVQGGPNISMAGTFSRSTATKMSDGDVVLLELATCVDGYWSDLTRTAPVGRRMGDRPRALLTAVRQAQAAAIAAVRPGVTHEQVDAVARKHLVEKGFGSGFTHNCGHHVGFRYHDRGPALQAGSLDPLEAGMVITVEPGSYGKELGGGARFEDDVLVTANGVEVLSPRDVAWKP
jgi:Xaa-Pro dipeptidase